MPRRITVYELINKTLCNELILITDKSNQLLSLYNTVGDTY